ncbi:VWA domain-containing protein [Candidatus Woesearchaeota archaeon]|nr:VWA domain-containing protein [Candidatus Woesearchaeota archaeon]
MNRKAFYFTMDALFSSFLLIGGLLLISQYLVKQPTTESISFASADVLSALSELKMREVNSTFVNTYLISNDNTKMNNSVLEQIGTYWATGNITLAINLTEFVMKDYFPNNTGFKLVIEDDVLFEKSTGSAPSNTLVGERMITGIEEGAPLTGSSSSAYVRKIQDKTTSNFAYFGGFVGQGKITVRLDDLPSDISSANVRDMFLEGEFDSDFQLLINDVFCDLISVDNTQMQRFNISGCSSLLASGDNTVTLNFTEGLTNASVSGGLLGVKYVTAEIGATGASSSKITYLPDIDGVINLYDGFMVPGNLKVMNISLHYWAASNVTLPLFMDVGNTNIFSANTTGENTFFFDNTFLDALLDYNAMSNTTIPVRMGFYTGNTTNTTGNISDVFLLTSRHYSMGTDDIIVDETTNVTRITQVRDVDNLFVDIVLNGSGNRVGLVSFGTGASVDLDSELTTNTADLHSEIDAYVQHPADAQRYLCGAMEEAKTQLITDSNSSRKRAILLMTDGDLKKTTGNTATCAYGQTSDRSIIWKDAVHQACNFTDYAHGNPYNITFYTVAFGPEAANDPAIVGNLSIMANCTGGKFAFGTNVSALNEIYASFAAELAASSIVYTFQRATAATSVESRLYGDSYIEVSYEPPTPAVQQSQIPITFQTPQFGSCNPTITIPDGVTVIDARVVSYSGDYWTKSLSVDGNNVYDLSSYAPDYINLGDPFQLLVPAQMLTTGSHSFSMSIGANSTHTASCSLSANNSLIYTGLIVAATNRTVVLPSSDGCNWTVESEDVEFQSLMVPLGYAGTKQCYYTNATLYYDLADAYDVAVYNLLKQLDPDDDKRVSVNFQDEDLEITVTLVTDVPYLWGPTLVKASVWQ